MLILDSIYYEIDSRRILNGVYIKIEPSSICGLFGLNGSGKSTIIRIAAGLLLPLSGTVFIDNKAFTNKSLKSRFTKIAYLPQDNFLPGDMKVSKFVNFFLKDSELDLENFIKPKLFSQNIASLSFGERRMLELIFIISLKRNYILLDEPFTGIEPRLIEKMLVLINGEADNGTGVLITDHYQHYVSQLCHYSYLQINGQSKKVDSPFNIKEHLGFFSL